MLGLIKYVWATFVLDLKRRICVEIGHKKGQVPSVTEKCREFYGWHFTCSRCGRMLDKDGKEPARRV